MSPTQEDGFRVAWLLRTRAGTRSLVFPSVDEPPCLAVIEANTFADTLSRYGNPAVTDIRVIDNRTGLPVDSIVRRKT